MSNLRVVLSTGAFVASVAVVSLPVSSLPCIVNEVLILLLLLFASVCSPAAATLSLRDSSTGDADGVTTDQPLCVLCVFSKLTLGKNGAMKLCSLIAATDASASRRCVLSCAIRSSYDVSSACGRLDSVGVYAIAIGCSLFDRYLKK